MDNTITMASHLKRRLIVIDTLKKKTARKKKKTKYPIKKTDDLSRWLITRWLRLFLKYVFFIILFLTICESFGKGNNVYREDPNGI